MHTCAAGTHLCTSSISSYSSYVQLSDLTKSSDLIWKFKENPSSLSPSESRSLLLSDEDLKFQYIHYDNGKNEWHSKKLLWISILTSLLQVDLHYFQTIVFDHDQIFTWFYQYVWRICLNIKAHSWNWILQRNRCTLKERAKKI